MKNAMLVLAVFGLVSLAWAADNPFIGTWKLNVAKSKVGNPSTMPKSETIVFTEQQGAIKIVDDGVNAQGKAYHQESVGKWDGKDVPVKDDPTADMVATKKINTNTAEIVFKKAGKEVSGWRITISKDGKEMTSVGKWKDAKGQEFSGTFVYDKQ